MLKKLLQIIAVLCAIPLILLGALFLQAIENGTTSTLPPTGDSGGTDTSPNNSQREMLVAHSHESDQSIEGMVIDEEILEALEKNYRQIFLRNLSQMYEQQGFSTSEMMDVTEERYTIVDGLFALPIGVANIRTSGNTTSGPVNEKYLYAAGIEGNTLHKVICMEFGNAESILMIAPKCQAKLVEVFGKP